VLAGTLYAFVGPESLTRGGTAYTFGHLPHLSRAFFACPGKRFE
jgi:hypothetical protein